jgi:hypothetical protein
LKWRLPIAHIALDLVLAGVMVYDGHRQLTLIKAHRVAYTAQEEAGGSVGFDPRYIDGPPARGMRLIVADALPVTLPLALLFPWAPYQSTTRLIDPLWLVSNCIAAFGFWFLIGLWIDKRARGLWWPAVFSLFVRVASADTLLFIHSDEPATAIVLLYWPGLAIWGLIALVRHSLTGKRNIPNVLYQSLSALWGRCLEIAEILPHKAHSG